MSKILAKVFYTPAKDPENVKLIEVTSKSEYKEIEEFIKKCTTRKRRPDLLNYESSGIRSSIVDNILSKKLEVTEQDCKMLFEYLYGRIYTSAKSSTKYWSVIVTDKFIFVYHFTPDESFSFEEGRIVRFIKYLDKSTLLRFLFISQKRNIIEYTDSEKIDVDEFPDEQQLIYSYERQPSKGFKELLKGEPVYESRGDLKVRIGQSESTDVVIETDVDYVESIINSPSIKVNFDEMHASLQIDREPIKEIEIAGKKYKTDEYDVEVINNRIKHEQLKIRKFIAELEWWRKNSPDNRVIEKLRRVNIGEGYINKPYERFNQKETIFIIGKTITEHDTVVDEIATLIRNNLNISIVEASRFNKKYFHLDIGDFSLFCKFDDLEQSKNLAARFTDIIERARSSNVLYRILSYLGLAVVVQNASSKNFSEIMYKSSIKALKDYFSSLYGRTPVMDLKEVDELGIEFKAGIRSDGRGFFESSPKKLADKIAEKSNSKDLDLILYFIGINEDSRDFSPIPLNRLRNEFHSLLRRRLKSNGWSTLLSENIPLNDREGLLLIIVAKTGGEE